MDLNPVTDTLESLRREREMNRLSTKMNQFHTYFKSQFNTLYELSDGSFERRGLSLTAFLRSAQDLVHHLTMHHTIEETHLFPILGKKMPQFAERDNGEHLESHRQIHDGLESLSALTSQWMSQPSKYSPSEFKACLDGFRAVLFKHLDDEVVDLRGENLKKYFTYEEVQRFPI